MPNREAIAWFKEQFAGRIHEAVAETPFSLDFVVAIACQETGYIWSALRKAGLPTDEILRLCVGDVIDYNPETGSGRKAFPRDKAALLKAARGQQMFDVARQALLDVAVHIPSYRAAAAKPDKFCRGFGVFQRDLQYFKEDPDYFLGHRYADFEISLQNLLGELRQKQRVLGLAGIAQMSVLDMVSVAIAYNTGRFDPRRGLKQGYKAAGGLYYGEAVFDYLRLSATVPTAGEAPLIVPPSVGEAILPPPSQLTASGPYFRVDTRTSTLYLRSEPRRSNPVRANVVGELPDGHRVRSFTGTDIKGFVAVETSLAGALLRGFASAKYLVPDDAAADIEVTALPDPTLASVPAVLMPTVGTRVTRRVDIAVAHSLNEPGQPGRAGSDAGELRQELANIVAWLDVEKPAHKRYQPRGGLTFCNIYCHDFCHLAGAYLPRVWWTPKSLVAWTQGRQVEPLYGSTICEMRANDLFRWLRDFGPGFGWRQTGTLTKLQLAANQGALALIVARRKEDGRSGHIVMVVPETDLQRSNRDAVGDVTAPLQSQAGVRNSRYGTSQPEWWKREQFAEFAFWIHP